MFKKLILSFIVVLGSLSMVSLAETKTLRLAYDADPVSLDPHEQLSGGMLQLSHMVFDPLFRYRQDVSFEPRLATEFKTLSSTKYQVVLREGVKFHTGRVMTATDVKWTIDRLKRSPDFKGIFNFIASVSVVDDKTIEIITKEPYGLVQTALTYVFPMDSAFYTGTDDNGNAKDAIVKNKGSFASTNAAGTGPYTVTERQQGVKVVFERNANYWDTKSPGNVDKIVLTPISENSTRVAALLSGDVDFISPVPPADYKRIQSTNGVDLITLSGTRVITFQLNQNRVEAFKDKRVRLAMAYAVNNVAIAKKLMRGYATPAAQFSPKGYMGYNPALKPRYNLKKARALMKEAGYKDGFTISMMAPNNRYVNDEKIAEAVANMLSKIKVKVELKTLPKAQYWDLFDQRAADVMMIGWHSDTEDSANFFEFLAMCPNADTGYGQYNSGNYCNHDVDNFVRAANRETNVAKRTRLLQKAEEIVHDEAGFLPLHWQDLSWAVQHNVKAKPILNVMNFPYLGDLIIK